MLAHGQHRMSRMNDLRLRKLEAKQFGRDEQHTRDEVAVEAYECALALLADPTSTEADRALASEIERAIRGEIISQVQALQDPDHQTWLKQFDRGWGGARWKKYVPAVTGNGNGMSEYSDLDRPDIMERRAALWARESMRRL